MPLVLMQMVVNRYRALRVGLLWWTIRRSLVAPGLRAVDLSAFDLEVMGGRHIVEVP